jgi:hypothetical protein
MQSTMNSFSLVTEAELSRARRDPSFRLRLLQQSLDALLSKLQRQRQVSAAAAINARQMQEGVALAVRLAEMIQAAPSRRANAERLPFRAGRV